MADEVTLLLSSLLLCVATHVSIVIVRRDNEEMQMVITMEDFLESQAIGAHQLAVQTQHQSHQAPTQHSVAHGDLAAPSSYPAALAMGPT